MPRLLTGLLAALALLALASPAAAAKRPLKMLWGPATLESGEPAFPLYRSLGVDVLQIQLRWRQVAAARPARPTDPGDPAYAWPAEVTSAVEQGRRTGIRVMLMVRETPDWANGDRGPARAPNRDRDYADFLRAAARRYPSVRHWMIWGEPQRGDQFTPMPANSPRGPRRYARLLDAAYGALKRERRRNLVIGGNTWTLGPVSPRDFVRWMRLPGGQPPRLDFYGHNPFSVKFPRLRRDPYFSGLRDISDSDTLARELTRAYRSRSARKYRRIKLWLSEFTVSSAPTNVFNFHVDRKRQARWLTAAFDLASDFRRRIAGIGWFRLQDTPDLESGLLDLEGNPKPAYDAFRRAG